MNFDDEIFKHECIKNKKMGLLEYYKCHICDKGDNVRYIYNYLECHVKNEHSNAKVKYCNECGDIIGLTFDLVN